MKLPLAAQAPADVPATLHRDACAALYARYGARIAPHRGLDRMLVSFQANRRAALYGLLGPPTNFTTVRSLFSKFQPFP
jgi:hypothetical protein